MSSLAYLVQFGLYVEHEAAVNNLPKSSGE